MSRRIRIMILKQHKPIGMALLLVLASACASQGLDRISGESAASEIDSIRSVALLQIPQPRNYLFGDGDYEPERIFAPSSGEDTPRARLDGLEQAAALDHNFDYAALLSRKLASSLRRNQVEVSFVPVLRSEERNLLKSYEGLPGSVDAYLDVVPGSLNGYQAGAALLQLGPDVRPVLTASVRLVSARTGKLLFENQFRYGGSATIAEDGSRAPEDHFYEDVKELVAHSDEAFANLAMGVSMLGNSILQRISPTWETPEFRQLRVSGFDDSVITLKRETYSNDAGLTGLYIAGPAVSAANTGTYEKHILRIRQHGNQIILFDSKNNSVNGFVKDGVVSFGDLNRYSNSASVLATFDQWAIEEIDAGGMVVAWKTRGFNDRSRWRLRRLENNGVELYTIDSGVNRPFRIRQSKQVFDAVFTSSNDRNIVFLVHGRGDDFEAEFSPAMIPYTQSTSNTTVVLLHWLSWGESSLRPYRQARNASRGLADFLYAYDRYKSRNPDRVGNRNVTLLTHSMGNIPLKVFMEDMYLKQSLQAGLLSSVVLSSADVPFSGHRHWVEEIDFAEQIFVLQNRSDLVLTVSSLLDSSQTYGDKQKLGRAFEINSSTDTAALATNARYLNLTHLDGVGHRPFNMFSYSGNQRATDLFKRLLNGESFEYPDPSIGLYRKAKLHPVYHFYSRDPASESTISE